MKVKIVLIFVLLVVKTNAQFEDIKISESTMTEFKPVVICDTSKIIFCWTDYRNDAYPIGSDCGKGGDIYFQVTDTEGNLIGENRRVTEDIADTSCNYSSQAFPVGDINKSGNFIFVWTDFDSYNTANLVGQLYNSDNSKRGENFLIGDETAYGKVEAQVILWDDNSFDVYWREEPVGGKGLKIFHQRYDLNGNRATEKNEYLGIMVEDFYAKKYTDKKTVLLADTAVYIHNVETGAFDLAGYVPAGTKQGIDLNYKGELFIIYYFLLDPFNVDEENTINDNFLLKFNINTSEISEFILIRDKNVSTSLRLPDISVADEKVVIIWADGRNYNRLDTYIQKFTNLLEKLGKNIKISHEQNYSNQDVPVVKLSGSKIIAGWTDQRSLIRLPLWPPSYKTNIWATIQDFDNPVPGEIIEPPPDTTKPFVYPVEPEIQLYPNPAHKMQTIEVLFEKEFRAKLEVYDILGRKIKTIDYSYLSFNKLFQARLDFCKEARGLYIIKVILEDETGTVFSKIIKSINY